MKASSRIPWSRGLFEGAVIVISILLAFVIDAWWDGVQERTVERRELENLAAELHQNRPALDNAIFGQELIERGIEELVAVLKAHSEESVTPVPASLLAALVGTPSYRPASGAMESVLNSGRLALISDKELRDMIGGWPGVWQDAVEHQSLQFEHTYLRTVPWLVENDVQIDPSLFPNRGGVLQGEVMATEIIRIEVRPGFQTLVGVRHSNARSFLRDLRRLRDYEDRMLDLIELSTN